MFFISPVYKETKLQQFVVLLIASKKQEKAGTESSRLSGNLIVLILSHSVFLVRILEVGSVGLE